MARTAINESDRGKPVVNAAGEKIGIVTGVRGGTAYVDPDPGITETVKSKLGWEDIDEDDYPLQNDRVRDITDDEIRLSKGL